MYLQRHMKRHARQLGQQGEETATALQATGDDDIYMCQLFNLYTDTVEQVWKKNGGIKKWQYWESHIKI